jgi:hypothetical protein
MQSDSSLKITKKFICINVDAARLNVIVFDWIESGALLGVVLFWAGYVT